MRHVIKTQIIDVETDRSTDAFTLQHALSSAFYRYILPELERIFDELAPGDNIISIDRVEIDLGIITHLEIEKNVCPQKFRDELYHQLKNILRLREIKITEAPLAYNICRQWLYYMEHGFLPWNITRTNQEWYNKMLEGFASDYKSIALLQSLIENNDKALRRIVMLHTPSYLAHLVEVITAKKQSGLVSIIETIYSIMHLNNIRQYDYNQPDEFRKRTWTSILQFVAAENKQVSEEEIIERIILKQLDFISLQQILDSAHISTQLSRLVPVIKKQLGKNNNCREKNKTLKLENEVSPLKAGKDKLPEDGLFVSNAGVVLLNPFLEQLFIILGLTDNREFKGRPEQLKALSILHYLSTGKTEFEEHELVINKILCGYPIDEIVDNSIVITPEEMKEADDLLEVIISRWTILKNTSASALRESFLQRGGKLLVKNDTFQLIIETDSVDVLLTHLPWGVSMIKYPWMPQLLKVDWK